MITATTSHKRRRLTRKAPNRRRKRPDAKPDDAQLAKLAAQSEGKSLALIDASEVQLDGAAALVLTFSIPLDPNQDFSRTVHVVDKTSGALDGAWELGPQSERAAPAPSGAEAAADRPPSDPALKALNKAQLEEKRGRKR